MPRKSPFPIVLSVAERIELEKIARKYTSPYYTVIRAKLILMAAQDMENDAIGQKLGLPRQIVSKWRKRFYDERLRGLEDRSRPGRPSDFPP
jgi:transposase